MHRSRKNHSRGRQNTGQRGRNFHTHVEKKYSNKLTECRISPPGEDIPISNDIQEYSLDNFEQLKNALNTEKVKMDKYNLESGARNFDKYLSIIRVTRALSYIVRSKYNGQHVTRAWLKFYELFTYFKLLDDFDHDVGVFLNAELPGAGICAFNHYVRTQHPRVNYVWRANSLVMGDDPKSRVEALGDVYGIWKNNRDNWLMDVEIGDKTRDVDPDEIDKYLNGGDTTSYPNILNFKAKLSTAFGKCDIYTHDAGIGVGENDLDEYLVQEYKNAKLHLGCAISAFENLKKGGAFVAKQYTFFEPFTITLMIIYSSMFREFYICKPQTSGHNNSEIYLVGKGFTGYRANIKRILTERLNNFNFAPFIPREILIEKYHDQLAEIYQYARLRNNEQIIYISESIELYEKFQNRMGVVHSIMKTAGNEFADIWIKNNPISRISDDDKIKSNG